MLKFLILIYQWLIACPLIVLGTILVTFSTTLGSKFGNSTWWGYYPPHLWGVMFCRLMFVRVTVSGKDNINPNTSYVFVANHQGAYDIFSVYGYLNHNFRWMMKKALKSVPFIGFACEASGQIFVDTKHNSGVTGTIREAQERLKNGLSLVVFPEGSRSHNGKMRKFKKGAFKLACDFNLPIVPITIDGSFDVLPRTTYNITPGHIHLTIHKPIEITSENFDSVITESYKTIEESLPPKYRN